MTLLAGGALGVALLALQPAPPALRGVGIEERLDEASRFAALRESLGPQPRVHVLLTVPRELVESPGGSYRFERLDARLGELSDTRPLLVLEGAPSGAGAESGGARGEDFARYLGALSERYAGRVEGYVIVTRGLEASDAARVFLLKLASVQIGAADPSTLVLVDDDGPTLTRLYDDALGLPPYVDGWVLSRADAADRESFAAELETAAGVIEARDPTARIVVRGVAALDERSRVGPWVETLTNRSLGAELTVFTGTIEASRQTLATTAHLRDLLTHELVPLDGAERGLRFDGADPEQGGAIAHELFYDVTASTTALFYWRKGGDGDESAEADADAEVEVEVEITLDVFAPSAPLLRDPLRDAREQVRDPTYDPVAMRSRVRVPLSLRPRLVELPESASSASVVARVDPTLEEIIARYRETERRRAARLDNYVAKAVDAIHFRPNPTDPGFDIVVENRLYVGRDTVETEELSFSVNGARFGSDRPAFPLLQPEKVLSLPLELNPEDDYRYTLLGKEPLGGRPCFVVGVEPARPDSEDRSLYRGRIWIDAATFHKSKLELVQTNLSSLVVSNEESHIYEPTATSGGAIYLLSRLSSKQIVLLAGRNIVVERETTYSDFEVNLHDFERRRQAARESEHIMMRDTDEGMRYLVKRGGEREIAETLTRTAKALAMGTLIDPSFDYPLPIVGLNYLDFDFMEKDAQLALLFGGVLAFGNLQRPHALGPLDLSVDFFGIAVRGNDKVFDLEGEDESRELLRLPGTIGFNLGWQFTAFQKVAAGYELRYDFFARGPEASEDFVEPSDTVTHGTSLRYEYRRKGYSLAAFGAYARRADWEPWGDVAQFDPSTRSYWKYNVTLGKDFFFGPVHRFHFDLGYFGGDRLDRFSRYQFGLFDETRIHGVPATAIRFEDLYLARASYSFNLFDIYRLDLFLDQARGDDPSGGSEHVRLTGVGTALTFRGPRSTIVRLDLGKSFLPPNLGSAGTFVAQILVLKPF